MKFLKSEVSSSTFSIGSSTCSIGSSTCSIGSSTCSIGMRFRIIRHREAATLFHLCSESCLVAGYSPTFLSLQF